MLQYLVYFLVGGCLVALVAFVAQKGNTTLAIIIANVPIMFLTNTLLMYRLGGVSGSLLYAKGALMYLPFYIVFVLMTIWLLPKLGMPLALLPGAVVFAIPVLIRRFKARHLKSVKHTIVNSPLNTQMPTASSSNRPGS